MNLKKYIAIIKKISPLYNLLVKHKKFQKWIYYARSDISGELKLHTLTELEKIKILSQIEPVLYPEDTLISIDSPRHLPSDEPFLISGWIASKYEIRKIWIPSPQDIELEPIERQDISDAYPFFPFVKGFRGMADKKIIEGDTFTLHYRLSIGDFIHTSVFAILPELSRQEKIKKLALIASHLICPQCSTKFDHTKIILDDTNSKILTCTSCHAKYSYSTKNFNFLPEEIKRQFDIVETTNVSTHELDPLALSIIGRYNDGIILDCGAGSHRFEYPNVINLEIVEYPSTDVQCVNERLPFQDETFDAVFSFAVLEHVKDPFRSAQEICRVLKRGGILYCVVPFLQPLHGYPNHYYNMTSQGLRNLFGNNTTILDYRVPVSGLPIWTLTWFLRSWADGLSGKTRQDFLNMKIKDLIENSLNYLKHDFVAELPEQKNFELASTTMIIGKKS